MKTVAIVGAGPAGLVAAKTLLRSRPEHFQVTIFESQDRVGGMWSLQQHETKGGKCSPEMAVNLSRYSVAFCDLSWDSVELDGVMTRSGQGKTKLKAPIYPRAWQVGKYLEEYARRFIPSSCIKTNCHVQRATRLDESDGSAWEIAWLENGRENTERFDRLIVSSGFFNTPQRPTFQSEPGVSITPVHSSSLRSLGDVVSPQQVEPGKIVIVGGSMSGSEAAVTVAMALSDKAYGIAGMKNAPKHDVYHVVTRPFYDIPRFVAVPETGADPERTLAAPRILPLDLLSYEISRRPSDSMVPSNGIQSLDRAEKTHLFMRSLVSGGTTQMGAHASTDHSDDTQASPFISITDRYTAFVSTGDVKCIRGRAVSLRPGPDGTATMQTVDKTGRTSDLERVVGVVHATGYTPHDGLSWLDPTVLHGLNHDVASARLPLLLEKHTTFHSSDPGIAFVGFHEGPFWAVMEMQAREIANKWNDDIESKFPDLPWEEPDMEALRAAMKMKDPNVRQFWMGDYVGNVEANAARQGIGRCDVGFGQRQGPVCAARYFTDQDEKSEADKALSSLSTVLRDSFGATAFAAPAIFHNLQGRWQINRKLESSLATQPSGTLSGIAHFHPRFPTAEAFSAEYLYVEEGLFQASAGWTATAKKSYVYRYSEIDDEISVWFTRDDGRAVDYLFHAIQILPRKDVEGNKGWQAVGSHHLCVKDNYNSSYEFRFSSSRLRSFDITYDVKGPKKDYRSSTEFLKIGIA